MRGKKKVARKRLPPRITPKVRARRALTATELKRRLVRVWPELDYDDQIVLASTAVELAHTRRARMKGGA